MYDSLKYVHGGKFSSRGVWRHPDRIIDTEEIIIPTRGNLYIKVGENEYSLSVGEVLRIPAGVWHGGTRETEEEVSFYWLHFCEVDGEELPPIVSKPESTYQSEILARQILHYANKSDYSGECENALMKVLLIELLSADKEGTGSAYKIFCDLREWVRINCDMPIKVSDAAKKFNYNPDYINRVFKKYFKDGLKAYIDREKLGKIKHELINRDMSLKELSDKYGFSEYKYFLKYFKYHEGVTPSEYRQTYCNIHTNNK